MRGGEAQSGERRSASSFFDLVITPASRLPGDPPHLLNPVLQPADFLSVRQGGSALTPACSSMTALCGRASAPWGSNASLPSAPTGSCVLLAGDGRPVNLLTFSPVGLF